MGDEKGKREMKLKEAIVGRRSVRKYRPDPVPVEVIEEIFEYALWAPSGMNRQNWYFIVLTGKLLEEVRKICAKSYREHIKKKVEGVFSKKPEVVEATENFFTTLGEAPVVVLAFADPGPESRETDIQTVSAAIQNLLLLAYEKGLGTCWMTGPTVNEEELKKLLGIEGKNLIALVTLGYPAETPRSPKRRPGRVEYIGFEGGE